MLSADNLLTFLFFVFIVIICTMTAYALTYHNVTSIYGGVVDDELNGPLDDAAAYTGAAENSDPSTMLSVYKSLSNINLNLKPASLLKKPQSQVISRTITNAKLHMMALNIHPTKLSIAAIKRDISILSAVSKHLRSVPGREEELISVNNIIEELKDKLSSTTSERTLSNDRETMFLEVAASCNAGMACDCKQDHTLTSKVKMLEDALKKEQEFVEGLKKGSPDTVVRDFVHETKIKSLELDLKKEREENEKLRRNQPSALMRDILHNTVQSTYTQCIQQNEDLRQRIQSLQRDISNLQSRPTSDPDELNRLRAERDSLQSELQRVRSSVEDDVTKLTMNLSKVENDLRRCNAELNACVDLAARA